MATKKKYTQYEINQNILQNIKHILKVQSTIKKVLLDIAIAPSGYNDGKALKPVKRITQKDDGTLQISARAHLRVIAEKYIQ